MAFDAFSCPSGARPSRVYVRYVERRPESSVPAANGHGTRPEPRREFRGHAPLQVGVQVNHGACPLGFQQRGKKTLLSLTLGPDRCLRSRNCPAGQFTLSLGVMWLSYEGSFQHTHTHTHTVRYQTDGNRFQACIGICAGICHIRGGASAAYGICGGICGICHRLGEHAAHVICAPSCY